MEVYNLACLCSVCVHVWSDNDEVHTFCDEIPQSQEPNTQTRCAVPVSSRLLLVPLTSYFDLLLTMQQLLSESAALRIVTADTD